jgi:HK97 gp10 family phage protein
MVDVVLSSDFDRVLLDAVTSQIHDVTSAIERKLKDNAPVRTGHLKSTCYAVYDASTNTIRFGATADYADEVEFGTTHNPPNPFIRKTAYGRL